MGEHNNVTCPNCEKRIDSKSEFCPHCGTKFKSALANCPKCGAEFKGFEKFCAACGAQLQVVEEHAPKTEKQFIVAIAAVDLGDPSRCKNVWNESLAYLKRYPKGKFVFEVLVTAEIAKAALALHRMGLSGEPDYSLYAMQSHESIHEIFEHEPDPFPKEMRTGLHIMPLSDSEIEALVSRAGIKATVEDLKKGFRLYQMSFMHQSATSIGRIKEAVADKYHKKLVNGKSKAELQGLSRDDLRERAEICYAMYQNNDFQSAASCFCDMTELSPLDPYNHNLLWAIHDNLREHEQALEEILYAKRMDPSDLKIQCNLAMTFRRLGLYVEAMNFFAGDEANVPEELDPNDSQRNELINTIWLERKLTFRVFWGLMNHLFSRALRLNQWQYMRNAAIALEKRQNEQEEQLARSLEGTSLFISYRRQDSGDHVDRLCELLQERLPDAEIFRDISGISIGQGWLEKLELAIKKADIVLAIIGMGWAGKDESGMRRLDERNDVLRRELTLALKEDVKIIPVLVNDASMPKREDVPSELRAIAQTQAFSLRHSSFNEDLQELASGLREILKPLAKERRETLERWDEAFQRNRGRLKIVLSDNILFSGFNVVGRWECKIKTPKVEGKLLFEIKHDYSFKGTWEPKEMGRVPVHGNVMPNIADDKDTLLGLRLEGLTEDAAAFAVNIPMDKKLGEGYQGTDESGGSYFLRLIERTKEGL